MDKGGKTDFQYLRLVRHFLAFFPDCLLALFTFPGRRRFLLIGVSVMTVSILTLGIVTNYTSLGQPTRKCHFNSTTTMQFANLPPSPSIPYTSTNMPPRSSFTNSANSSSNLALTNSTASDLNTTESKSTLASKGLRYFTLSALVLFVGAYSFSFGPGKLFHLRRNQLSLSETLVGLINALINKPCSPTNVNPRLKINRGFHLAQ